MNKFLDHVKSERNNPARWEMRDDKPTRALTAEQRAEIAEAIKTHNERAKSRTTPITLRDGERYVNILKRTRELDIAKTLKPIFLSLYRKSESSWAGGHNTLKVEVSNTPDATGYSELAWSSNGKWSGHNATFDINVMINFKRDILNVAGLVNAGGMLTTHAEQTEPNLWRASWVRQGRGFKVYSESGYILRDGDEWYHAKTEKSVRQLKTRREGFTARVEKNKRLSETLRGMSASDLSARFGALTIRIGDSLRAGNCESGTRNWIERNFPGRETGTVSEVLSADADRFVIRAVQAAILRQSAQAQKLVA